MFATVTEVSAFVLMVELFVIAIVAVAVWSAHTGVRTPLVVRRQRLRRNRDLSAPEFAIAAYRDPATVLCAVVIELLDAGEATVVSDEPLLLDPAERRPLEPYQQQILQAYQDPDLNRRGPVLVAALEALCDDLTGKLEGYSVGLTVRYGESRATREFFAFRPPPYAGAPQGASAPDLAFAVAAQGFWTWADEQAARWKTLKQYPAHRALLQEWRVDGDRMDRVRSLRTLRQDVIRLDDLVAYLDQHGDGQYVKWSELPNMMRESLTGQCARHPDTGARYLCRHCNKAYCPACFDGLHSCCLDCLYPHHDPKQSGGRSLAPSFFDANPSGYLVSVAPRLLTCGFRPALDSRFPAYARLGRQCDALFVRQIGEAVQLLCFKSVPAVDKSEVQRCLEQMLATINSIPGRSQLGRPSARPCGVLALLTSAPVDAPTIKATLRLRAGHLVSGIVARPWIVDTLGKQVHPIDYLDAWGESVSAPIVAVLEAGLEG